MFGSVILEVIIGVIFVFLLVSIICSALREGVEAWLKTRAAYLEHGIRELLHHGLDLMKREKTEAGDEPPPSAVDLARCVYEHPLIYGLFSGPYQPGKGSESGKPPLLAKGGNLPSYIPSKNFAVALMDIAARGPQTDEISSHPASPVISLQTVRTNLLNIESPFVRRALLTAIDAAQGSLEKAQKNIEAWYDSGMDRVSGWYKRSTQWMLFWIGLAVAVSLNINTVTVIDYLYKHDAERKAVVARAEAAAKDTAFTSIKYAEAKKELETLKLPIGWSQGWGALTHTNEPWYRNWWNNVWAPLLGWLLTALAATMGAPFWFDLLNKVTVIRSTVKPHEKSPEEASEDRQPKTQPAPVVNLQGQQAESVPPENLAAAVPASMADVPVPRDATSRTEGCGIETDILTEDEELPPSEGGVAE